jgi:WhiB family transcriptional regulator, redox-sensing transcriptional regulator
VSGQRILPERSDSEWMSRAECANYPPDWWFPARGQPSPQARSVCLSCPVRTECLDYAIAHNERHGIWGGLSEKQRRLIRRNNNIHALTRRPQ